MKGVRPPAVAGLFYPASPAALREDIAFHLSKVTQPEDPKHYIGIISPHAGYVYSGFTAAHGFKAVKDNHYKTVIIISPSHQEYFRGVSVFSGDAYETPLGTVPVNKEVADAFTTGDGTIFRGPEGHRREHAVEVQLPFLQYCLGSFDFVPVVMGDQSHACVSAVAEKLFDIADETMLVVASSDLSHYCSREAAARLDGRIVNRINGQDPDGLENDLHSGAAEACGGGPMVALMKGMRKTGREKIKVLYQCDSGDVSGDTSEVVGYLSAVMFRP